MVQKIALFNHKGGVSKTTTTFHLGWMLASKGKRVILVDTDPQCNLTGLVLDYKGEAEIEDLYEGRDGRDLKSGLAPAFESRPVLIKAVECYQVEGQDNLFLLPGHIGLSEYEVTLGIAQQLSGTIQTLQNLPGSISRLIEQTAEQYEADYVLIDMPPSLSPFNQNLLMTSDFFIVPTSPDYFSMMAINSLSRVIPNWRTWADRASSLEILRDAVYPFPDIVPKFLGTVVQNYRPRGGAPARGFQVWIDKINKTVSENLTPKLGELGMLFSENCYAQQEIYNHCLATIPDFNSLIAKSQDTRTPVFALTEAQIGQGGAVLERTIESRDHFKELFSGLADKVIGLTGHASCD
jgi:cellulose biosynthesis protein BcsQ